ncbi:MAG TPA: HEPN domain-containing protein [bacterium]|nr:HEPN domain-containing protein [bacterium]
MTQDDGASAHRDAVANWLFLAQSDLDYAVLGSSAGHIHPNLICFHLQRCVEKALKAVLVHRGLGVPRTHDLADLAVGVNRSYFLHKGEGEFHGKFRYPRPGNPR